MSRQILRSFFVILPAVAAIALALSAILTFTRNAYPVSAVGENIITSPDTIGDVGMLSSMVLDSSGFPVISYRGPSGELRLMHCNDVNCASGDESIESFPSVSVNSTTLALDANGFPVIGAGRPLQFIHCNDANCAGGDDNVLIFSFPFATPNEMSLVLDASGFPVFAFQAATGASFAEHLGLFRCNDPNCVGGGESFEFAAVGLFNSPSIELDASGFPVIASHSRNPSTGEGDLKIVHCNDLNCAGSNESIEQSPDSAAQSVGAFASLALDASGFPVVSYRNGDTGDLAILHCNDVNCDGDDDAVNTISHTGDVNNSTSLVLDGAGSPVVSFTASHPGGANTQAVHCNDVNCAGGDDSAVTVDANGSGLQCCTSLALDASGFPVVSFYVDTSGGGANDLRVLHCGDANCSIPANPTPTNTIAPATATHTATPTPVPPTATNTPSPTTATFTATSTTTPTTTNTATSTSTIVPLTATLTATATNTPLANTATFTPTNSPTATPTPTSTLVPPAATHTPKNTTPPATATNTLTPTATKTPVPPTATNTPSPTATAVGDRCADINNDGRVNVGDILRIAVHIFRPYSAVHDINRDSQVTLADLFAAARQYGPRRC